MDRLTFPSLQPLSSQRAVSEKSTFRYSVQSKQLPPRAISDHFLRVCEWWRLCVFVQTGVCFAALPAFLQLLSVTLFLSCSHLLPHNGFSVMIVVFCSALTHEALRLTMGAHVCCITMKWQPQISQRQDGWDFDQHLEKERNGRH